MILVMTIGGQADPAGRGGQQPQEGLAGAGRQVSADRARRRRPGHRGGSGAFRPLLQPRPVLLRGVKVVEVL